MADTCHFRGPWAAAFADRYELYGHRAECTGVLSFRMCDESRKPTDHFMIQAMDSIQSLPSFPGVRMHLNCVTGGVHWRPALEGRCMRQL